MAHKGVFICTVQVLCVSILNTSGRVRNKTKQAEKQRSRQREKQTEDADT